MGLSAESSLMLLAVLLYLYDASRLLSANEAILIRGHRRWRARFGSHRWTLLGKEPYLGSPLLPHRPSYRLRWHFTGSDVGDVATRSVPDDDRYDWLAPFVVLSGLCLFCLLPLGLFMPAAHWLALLALLTLYVSNLTMLGLLYRRRTTFGIDTPQFTAVALECLFCPPFAINVVQKLCTLETIDEDFETAARRLLDVAELNDMNVECRQRMGDAIAAVCEGDEAETVLLRANERFESPPGES